MKGFRSREQMKTRADKAKIVYHMNKWSNLNRLKNVPAYLKDWIEKRWPTPEKDEN